VIGTASTNPSSIIVGSMGNRQSSLPGDVQSIRHRPAMHRWRQSIIAPVAAIDHCIGGSNRSSHRPPTGPTTIGYKRHRPSAIGHLPSAIGYRPSSIGTIFSAIGHPPSAMNIQHRPSAIGNPASAIGHRPLSAPAMGNRPPSVI
jgi:hypothetical protein